jgi:hypothetical protein
VLCEFVVSHLIERTACPISPPVRFGGGGGDGDRIRHRVIGGAQIMLFHQLVEDGMDGNLVQAKRHRSLNAGTENHRKAVRLKQTAQNGLYVLIL